MIWAHTFITVRPESAYDIQETMTPSLLRYSQLRSSASAHQTCPAVTSAFWYN